MAIIKIVAAGKTKASLKAALNYIANNQKITLPNGNKLSTGLNCWGNLNNIYETMISTKEMYRKADDNKNSEMYKHFQQAFKPKEIKANTAHQIGIQWANINFAQKGYEVFICTHLDKEHIHNHFIINSVNALTGKTIQIHANKTLEELKFSSDELCKKYNLSVIERNSTKSSNNELSKVKYNMNKRYSILNEEFKELSWQKDFYDTILKAVKISHNKGFYFFERELSKKNIIIEYKRLKEDIIFINNFTKKRISNINLENTFLENKNYLSRNNLEKIIGKFPEYKLEKEKILSAKKQGFYELVENLIKVIDNAKLNYIKYAENKNDKTEFYSFIERHGWHIKNTPTGRAFYHENSNRLVYDTTIYKIVKNNKYCLVNIEKEL